MPFLQQMYLFYLLVSPDPDTSNLPADNAPPPSYVSVSKAPDRPPPPMPKQAPAMLPRPQEADMFSFGNEPPPPSFDDVYDVSILLISIYPILFCF